MIESEVFLKYEKSTAVIDSVSKILAIAMFATVAISAIVGFVFNKTIDFIVCFYVAAAAAVIYALVAMPLRIISIRRQENVNLCRSYVKVLTRNPHNAVDEIREGTGESDDKIVDNFAKLNALGFFNGIFIDKENKIVNSGNVKSDKEEFECPICGGKNETCLGQTDKCDFCGAVMEKETKDYGN